MEVEHTVKVFPLDANLQNNIQNMTAEGWLLLPGVSPVAIYHCVRIKGDVASQDIDGHKPVAKISIDETKVHIMRDGQLVDG